MNWQCLITAMAEFLRCQGWLQTQAQRQSLINCLIRATLAAAPTFFSAFTECMEEPPGPPEDPEHKPGSRRRCS